VLAATGKDTTVPILWNHLTRNTLKVLGTGKAEVDIMEYFRGGKEPLAYELTPDENALAGTVFATASVFTAELDKDTGVLTISARSATATLAETSYTTGEKVTLKATDADKAFVAAELTIKANREPGIPTDNDAIIELTVGTQNATDTMRDGLDDEGEMTTIQPNPVCATFGSCVFTIKLNDTDDNGNATFTPNVEGIAPADNDRQVVVTDDDTTGMTFSVESNDEQVQVSASGATITIVGLKTTYDADASPPAHVPASVTIRAKDENGLWVDRDLAVTVNTPPEVKSAFEAAYSFPRATAAATVIVGVSDHFKDAEGDTLVIRVKSSDAEKVAFPDSYDDGMIPGGTTDLQVIPRNIGSATITVTAVDARGQMMEQSFTVRVTAPAPAS
jgi:hypothetical protein